MQTERRRGVRVRSRSPVACREAVEGADRLPIAGVAPPHQESLSDRLSNPCFEGPRVERSPCAVTGDERDRGEHPGDDAVAQSHSQTDEGRDAQGGEEDRQPQKAADRLDAPDQCDDPVIVGLLCFLAALRLRWLRH